MPPNGRLVCDIRFDVLRIWEEPVDDLERIEGIFDRLPDASGRDDLLSSR